MKSIEIGPDAVLYHGDCLEILPTLEAGSVDVVVTDPPYGINLKSNGVISRGIGQIRGDENGKAGRIVELLARGRGYARIFFASPKHPWPGPWRQHLVW